MTSSAVPKTDWQRQKERNRHIIGLTKYHGIMKKICMATLNKANESLKGCGKQMSIEQNSDKTFALYLNGMLIYWSIPEERLFTNIMVVFLSNINA